MSDLLPNRAGDAERIRLQRDRYRKALEEIAGHERVCSDYDAAETFQRIAREALKDGG